MLLLACSLVLLPCLITLDKIPTIKDENGILVEVPPTIEPPEERQLSTTLVYNETSVDHNCSKNNTVPALPDDLNMKKLMGR